MKTYLIVVIMILYSFFSFGQVKSNIEKGYHVTDIIIKNVSVITMKTNEVLKNQDIVIKDGIIVSISNSKEKSIHEGLIIDGSNKYVMPSLGDAHVHLPKNKNDLEKTLILNLINGITKIRSMRGQWNHLEWRNEFNTKTSIYPKLYLAAPPISRQSDFSNHALNRYINEAKKFDFIKILSIKNDSLFKVLDHLCKVNNIDIGGHFPSQISDDYLFKSNYTSFEHLGGLTIKESKLLDYRIKYIKDNNIFICPTLSWYNIGSGRHSYQELRNLPGLRFVSKTTLNSWIEKTKQYRDKLGPKAYKEEVDNELKKLDIKYKVIKRLNELGVRMLLSPDSSSKYMISGFGIVGEMTLLKNAGLTNFEILKMVTTNFAAFFNESYGRIEVEEAADFIILNNNPLDNLEALKTIEGLYFNKNYLNQKALKKLSKSILPN
ncbi:amidohydrolase family protein [Olleya sp. Bg11-27]|uniref:amidohydrolase family protein n=1 Tax=Olleya sp. Bg11-27 TaxID=2058135 RepID=UPI000C3010B2|nr:amidohydrolase family protein [Olleya sp. Bg11-27]AUC76478.1 hypothetical protein CW732_12690 [Olleya sp. Bg11-27]